MQNKITISAPGKLMLFGEHAVVDGHPCIVTAVDELLQATVEVIDTNEFRLEAPEMKISKYTKLFSAIGKGDIPKGAKFVEIAVRNVFDYRKEDSGQTQNDKIGLHITTKSAFSSQFGFGSSSAVTVCIIKALSELFALNLSQKEQFDLAYKTVLDVQGKGSGFDVAAAIYGGTLYFVTAGKEIEPLQISSLPLVVGYSGLKADTVTLMQQVKEKFAADQIGLGNIYTHIEKIVTKAKAALVKRDWQRAGMLMSDNQQLLVELGVSTAKLDAMITAAISAGAYGAKLSGAGGGDCMIALVPEEKQKDIEDAIENVGGEVLHVKANAEGVKVE